MLFDDKNYKNIVESLTRILFYTQHTLYYLGNLLELLEFRSAENKLIRKKLGTLKYTHHSIFKMKYYP